MLPTINPITTGGIHGSSAGIAIAYTINQATGTFQFLADLESPSVTVGDQFGSAVAVSATGLIAVGAYADDGGEMDAGSVFVFTASSDVTDVASLGMVMPGSPSAGGNLGSGLAIDSAFLFACGDSRMTNVGVIESFSVSSVLTVDATYCGAHGGAFTGQCIGEVCMLDVCVCAHS